MVLCYLMCTTAKPQLMGPATFRFWFVLYETNEYLRCLVVMRASPRGIAQTCAATCSWPILILSLSSVAVVGRYVMVRTLSPGSPTFATRWRHTVIQYVSSTVQVLVLYVYPDSRCVVQKDLASVHGSWYVLRTVMQLAAVSSTRWRAEHWPMRSIRHHDGRAHDRHTIFHHRLSPTHHNFRIDHHGGPS